MVKTFKEFVNEQTLTSDDYLHGYCQYWVLDNYKPGDKVFVMTDYDNDIQDYALVHCGLMRNGKYVDVRGTMNTEEDVLTEFDYGPELETTIMTIDEFKEYCKHRLIKTGI